MGSWNFTLLPFSAYGQNFPPTELTATGESINSPIELLNLLADGDNPKVQREILEFLKEARAEAEKNLNNVKIYLIQDGHCKSIQCASDIGELYEDNILNNRNLISIQIVSGGGNSDEFKDFKTTMNQMIEAQNSKLVHLEKKVQQHQLEKNRIQNQATELAQLQVQICKLTNTKHSIYNKIFSIFSRLNKLEGSGVAEKASTINHIDVKGQFENQSYCFLLTNLTGKEVMDATFISCLVQEGKELIVQRHYAKIPGYGNFKIMVKCKDNLDPQKPVTIEMAELTNGSLNLCYRSEDHNQKQGTIKLKKTQASKQIKDVAALLKMKTRGDTKVDRSDESNNITDDSTDLKGSQLKELLEEIESSDEAYDYDIVQALSDLNDQ